MMILSESTQNPTISDVAQLAGVSISTVSRVLNETAPVAEETVQRVRAAIKKLNYVPHAAARTLAVRRTNTIGLLLPEISGAFFAPMLRGIEAGIQAGGFDLLIHATHAPDGDQRSPRQLGEHNTDGLLVFTNYLEDAEIIRLSRKGFPLVLLHRSPPNGLNIPFVTFENKAGARRLVDHLIEAHGYRRIAFLEGPANNEDSYWRKTGYQESLLAHGIPFDPALVAVGEFHDVEAQSAVDRWLAQGRAFDAIFAGDDQAAMGVILALRSAGVRIPEDVAVVGFDDVPFARHLIPPLTTVRAPIEKAGLIAAQQLVNLIQTGAAKQTVLLPTELVIRRSCGCS
jgi:LacI family transcriptional regulator